MYRNSEGWSSRMGRLTFTLVWDDAHLRVFPDHYGVGFYEEIFKKIEKGFLVNILLKNLFPKIIPGHRLHAMRTGTMCL